MKVRPSVKKMCDKCRVIGFSFLISWIVSMIIAVFIYVLKRNL